MRHTCILAAMTSAIVFLAMANIFCGPVNIPANDVWNIICGEDVEGHYSWSLIIRESRIPQTVTAMFCGASLGTCGLLLQTAFRNPLAGPSILGIDAGANLGVALVLLGSGATAGSLTVGGHMMVVTAALFRLAFTAAACLHDN